MSPGVITRRDILQAGSVALGAAMVPIGIAEALAADTVPAVFDPAAFLADLTAAGYGISAYWDVPRGGEPAGPSTYLIRPSKGRGFGASYTAVMAKWNDAMNACPDRVERVVDHVFEQNRMARDAGARSVARMAS